MSAPPIPTTEPAAPAGPKLWTIGTLTYTTGGLVILFCWLLAGDFAWSMKERSVPWVVQLLLKQFEASDFAVGTLIGTLPQALALVLTPIVSYRSDRHRGRWGRRIPFLVIPTPIAALSMVGLAYSPAMGTALHGALGAHSFGLNQSILITFGFFWTIFEVATITANAVFFGLINDVVPKAVIGRFYGMFRATGLGVAMIFNFWLFGKAETHYTEIFIGIGLLYGIGFTAMCLKVKEGGYPPPPPVQPSRAGGLVAAVKTYFRESFTQPYYLWLYASIALSWMAILGVNLFNLYFAKKMNMSMDTYGKYLAATFLISFLLSYFFGILADRFHPLRLGLAMLAVYMLVTLAGGLFVHDAQSFGIALIAYGVASGAWQTSTASLTMRLLPQARFAQFESARGLVSSFGMMLVGPALGWYLDRTGQDYRHVYLASAMLAGLAFLTGWVVHRKFMRYGGPANYVAPE
jgi:MFS family permease